jgi:hypothetical protein
MSREGEAKDERIADLEGRLSERTVKAEELEQHLTWKKVEFENLLESKEVKISQLQKDMAVKEEVGRLQAQVQQLYLEREAEMGERMREVSRRARTPSIHTIRAEWITEQGKSDGDGGGGDGQPDSLDSWTVTTMERPFSVSDAVPPVLRPLPNPASTRSKVFRHKLQKTLRQQQSLVDSAPFLREEAAKSVASVGNGASAASAVASSATEVSRTPSLINLRQHRKSLPHDYKAVVATLPPIETPGGGKRRTSAASRKLDSAQIGQKHHHQLALESKAEDLVEAPETPSGVVNASATSAGSERPATESFA